MKKLFILIFLLFLFLSCVSTDEQSDTDKTGGIDSNDSIEADNEDNSVIEVKDIEDTGMTAPDSDDSEEVLKMWAYLDNGLNKIEEGSISEGIKQLVSVLAVETGLKNPSDEAKEIASWAEAKLTKLAAAISLEADAMWLDSNRKQITGDTVGLNIQPSIILLITSETGKSVISNAPIYFEFVKGSGNLNSFVNTNSSGQAGCNITGFQDVSKENVVRAYLEYRIDGYTYSFSSAVCEFTYVPPANTAVIVVLEKSVLGISDNPLILDPVFNELKQIDYEFSIYNSILDEEEFMLAFKGDLRAIKNLGLESEVSYLVMLLNDCNNIIQMTNFQGQPINAFMAEAKATIRIIRVADGTVLYQKDIERNHDNGLNGQGNNQSKAALNVQREISDDMALDIRVNFREIQEALSGM